MSTFDPGTSSSRTPCSSASALEVWHSPDDAAPSKPEVVRSTSPPQTSTVVASQGGFKHIDEPRLVGGHVALDLVNTVAPRLPGRAEHVEYIATPRDLLAWAHRARLETKTEVEAIRETWAASPAVAAQALHAVVDIREATYGVLMAALGRTGVATPGAADELERLNLRLAAASARSGLVLGGPQARRSASLWARHPRW